MLKYNYRILLVLLFLIISYPISAKNSSEELKIRLIDKVSNYIENKVSSSFENTEFKIEGKKDSDPNFSIITLNPISENKDKTFFFQGSLFHESGRNTINTGLGYRFIDDDEKWIYGLNVFHDMDLNQGHRRYSVGGEIKGSLDLNLNKYWATSDTKYDKETAETALDGHEIEIGGQIPYIPSAKIFIKSWKWNGSDGVADTNGKTYSIEMNSPLTPNVTLEAGIKDYNDTSVDDVNFISLNYNIDFVKKNRQTTQSFNIFSDKAFEDVAVNNRLNEMVRRKNKIVVQKGFVSKAGGI